MLKALIDTFRQHARIYGQCKQKNRNSNKGPQKSYESKNTIAKMNTAFDGLQCRSNTIEERISELEDISIETHKREKTEKYGTEYPKYSGRAIINILIMEKKKFETIMTENFPQINFRHKKQIQKAQRTARRVNGGNGIPRHIIFKLQNIKDEEKSLKEVRVKRILCLYSSKDKSYI